MKGQATLSLATTLAAISFVAAPVIGFYSAQMATAADIAKLNTEVQVAKSKALDTDERLDRMEATQARVENKVDALLINSGINPKEAAKQ